MVNSANSVVSGNDISVILAVYNGERYIHKQIDSILTQKHVIIKELIIIDDKSTDQSVDIIRKYEQKYTFIKFVNNEVNIGPIGSFIKGAKLTSANYVAFADQDDIWLNDKLSFSLNLLKQIDVESKPSVVFTDLKMIDEEDSPLYDSFWKLYHIKPGKNIFFTILFGNIATGCTMVINRKMISEFVVMPLGAQMHDHWIMLIASSFGNWGYVDKQTVLYRVHNNSVTNKNKVTLRIKAMNFLQASFSKNPEFLSAYVDQAILYKSYYGQTLNSTILKQLNYFIKLKSASGFIRKINSKFRFQIYRWL